MPANFSRVITITHKQAKFTLGFEDYKLVGDTLPSSARPALLLLHGGGDASRKRFSHIREKLLEAGISSCAFDFAGSGESGGSTCHTSLESRTRQAGHVIAARQLRRPLSLVGASMGAYTAVKLLRHHRVANLILFVPGMYALEAYRKKFQSEFSSVIRKPHSWIESDAWDILGRFKGRLFVVAAENDPVIPDDVITRILAAARNVRSKKQVIVPGAPHQILSYLKGPGCAYTTTILSEIVSMLTD